MGAIAAIRGGLWALSARLSGSRTGGGLGRPAPRAYAAGKVTRLDPDFVPPNRGLNVQNQSDLDLARRRVRALVLDNPLLKGACDLFVRNTVGAKGIFPEPDTGFPDVDAQIEDVFWQWARGVDVARRVPLVASQRAFVRELWTAGETLVHYPFAPAYRGAKAGLAIELIDSDRLPMSYTRPLEDTAIGSLKGIIQGVEFDEMGREVRYHVLKSNPYDAVGSWSVFAGFGLYLNSEALTAIDARDAVLAFVPQRLGQIRGVPWAVSVVDTVRLEESFTEAELVLAKARACLGVIFKGATARVLPDSTVEERMVDSDGKVIGELQPGMIGYTPPNVDPMFLTPTAPGQGLSQTDELLQRRMASGLGIGYGLLTRDRSKSSFSSDRADSIEDGSQWDDWQMLYVWHQHTKPAYERLIDLAILAGDIRLTGAQRRAFEKNPGAKYNCEVITPGRPYVNPLQEAQADEVSLRTGTKSLADICGRMGHHWADVKEQSLQEELYEIRRRETLGLPPLPPPGGSTPATPATPGNPSRPAQTPDNTNAPADPSLTGPGSGVDDGAGDGSGDGAGDGTDNGQALRAARRRSRRSGGAR